MRACSVFITILIIALTLFCPCPLPAGSPPGEKLIPGNDYVILPGKRAGTIELGDSIDRVEARIGRGIIAPRKDFQIYSFPRYLMDLCVQKDQIVMILLVNPRYRTREGISVGESSSSIIRAFGKQYEYEEMTGADHEYIIQYWEKGISFSIRKERIVKIKVFNQKLVMKQMFKQGGTP